MEVEMASEQSWTRHLENEIEKLYPLKDFHEGLPTPPLAMFSFEELMLDYSGVLNDLRGRIENEMDLQVDPNVYNDLGKQRDDLEKRAFEIRQLLGLEECDEEDN
jgi:hypothetical protein